MIRKLTAVVGVVAVTVRLGGSAQEDAPAGKDWDTTDAVGLNLTHGNSETMLASASVRTEHEQGKHSLRMGLEGAHGETEVVRDSGETYDEVTARNAKAAANYKHKWEVPYLYSDAALEHDDVAHVDYRLTAGPGVGATIVDRDNLKIETDFGLAYVREEVGGETDDYASLRLSEYYAWQISKGARLWQEVQFLPRADDLDDYLLNGEVGVEAALNASMSLRLVFKLKYDSTPAAGQEQSDVALTSSLTWRLP